MLSIIFGHFAGEPTEGTGEPFPASLAYLRSVAGITVGWSPNGRFFLLGTIPAVGAVANDPLYAGWSATAGISAEWRL